MNSSHRDAPLQRDKTGSIIRSRLAPTNPILLIRDVAGLQGSALPYPFHEIPRVPVTANKGFGNPIFFIIWTSLLRQECPKSEHLAFIMRKKRGEVCVSCCCCHPLLYSTRSMFEPSCLMAYIARFILVGCLQNVCFRIPISTRFMKSIRFLFLLDRT
ncbi:hypothetical protein BJY01DRAFT_158522 [Aspergillus pseudoustus]|uniref:Uncharacterized protein n=1 Tax=Aspergillus pseudoustus TaxID=1810923 RepID=A0ABR4KY15_9EURO